MLYDRIGIVPPMLSPVSPVQPSFRILHYEKTRGVLAQEEMNRLKKWYERQQKRSRFSSVV